MKKSPHWRAGRNIRDNHYKETESSRTSQFLNVSHCFLNCKQTSVITGHAFAWLFYYQVPRESSSIRFVVKSSPTGLTLLKHTASRSFIGGGNYG
nr:MAG TPA: hypothetical protein [Caudoviricetes sp.]